MCHDIAASCDQCRNFPDIFMEIQIQPWNSVRPFSNVHQNEMNVLLIAIWNYCSSSTGWWFWCQALSSNSRRLIFKFTLKSLFSQCVGWQKYESRARNEFNSSTCVYCTLYTSMLMILHTNTAIPTRGPPLPIRQADPIRMRNPERVCPKIPN